MGLKVLVVDDSLPIRQQIETTLSEAGYQVLEAADGLEGLAALTVQPDIALVICDFNMPNMNGLEMLAAVKADARYAALPIVMLTTEGKAELIQLAKRIGARGWMVKPFKPEQLIAVVRKLLAN